MARTVCGICGAGGDLRGGVCLECDRAIFEMTGRRSANTRMGCANLHIHMNTSGYTVEGDLVPEPVSEEPSDEQ